MGMVRGMVIAHVPTGDASILPYSRASGAETRLVDVNRPSSLALSILHLTVEMSLLAHMQRRTCAGPFAWGSEQAAQTSSSTNRLINQSINRSIQTDSSSIVLGVRISSDGVQQWRMYHSSWSLKTQPLRFVCCIYIWSCRVQYIHAT